MTILDRISSIDALGQMQEFHEELRETFSKHGMDLLEDLGRRNILLSSAQEKFFASTIERYTGAKTESDGRTGQSDIVVIKDHGDLVQRVEIECKLTTRNAAGGVSLKTDYRTLSKKGCLNYLYVVADRDFQSFAVLYFENLTTEHFYAPHDSSRGKSTMIKHAGFQKCQALVGSYHCINEERIKRLESDLLGYLPPFRRRSALKSLEYWKSTHPKYSINLERLYSRT